MYKHITSKDRKEIAYLLARKYSYAEIARVLNVHRATITREYHRNKDDDGVYRVRNTHKKAKERYKGKQEKNKVIENNNELKRYVISSLKQYWSPEQVSGRLKRNGTIQYVSAVSIYAFLERSRKDLKKYRRHKRHRRLSKLSPKQAKKHMIDTRPKVVDKRIRFGDWEGDTIVGKERKERIVTYVDRKSGLLLARRTKADSHSVRIATKDIFNSIPCKTITYDNGSEFAAFECIERDIDITVYFAFPGKPHQRGCNENANGLLRQFFPKGSSFATVTQKDVDKAVLLINTRPRKRLGYRTPLEVFPCCG